MSRPIERALELLKNAETHLALQKSLVGLDGFIDQILRVVDKRQADGKATYISDIPEFAKRTQAAAGKSTKFEMAVQQVKFGGNGPIMAQALASFGLPTTCIGNLGFPDLHPIFHHMKKTCEVLSIADVCFTDALEFDDGKIMLSRQDTAREVTWENLIKILGKEKVFNLFNEAAFIALDNWTAIPHMPEIWRQLQSQVCPQLSNDSKKARRKIFFDLADPEFRLPEDIREALDLISKFQKWFDVTLGLNEKEAGEICDVLKLKTQGKERPFVRGSAEAICSELEISSVVVHAVAYAAAASKKMSALVEGPYIAKPLISTGAGDHFNAGYGLGTILEGDLEQRLQLGVATSGFYVRTAKSPSIADLREFLVKIG